VRAPVKIRNEKRMPRKAGEQGKQGMRHQTDSEQVEAGKTGEREGEIGSGRGGSVKVDSQVIYGARNVVIA
jgi:hypothetical protein